MGRPYFNAVNSNSRRAVEPHDVAPAGQLVGPSRRGAVVRWALLLLAAAAVAAWFLLVDDEGAAPGGRRGGGGPKAAPVTVASVTVGAFEAHASWPGELVGEAADVGSLVPGRLTAVHVRIGDRVEAGQLLAEIDVVSLERQRAEAAARAQAAAASQRRATVELRASEREKRRVDAMVARGVASAQDADLRDADVDAKRAAVALARANAAQADAQVATLDQQLAEARVVAPFAGVVAAREQDPGNFVAVGATIVRVVARDPLRVRFEVPEAAVPDLLGDRPVRVTAPPTGEAAHVGHVTGTAGEVSRERRVVGVEAVVDDPPASWLPGMYAEVEIVRRALDRATIVPAPALLSRLDGASVQTGVFVVDGDSARWIPVEVLAREGKHAAIDGDVAPDARVLVSGHTDLADGSELLVKASGGATEPRGGRASGAGPAAGR